MRLVDGLHQGKVLRRLRLELMVVAGARQAQRAALAAQRQDTVGRLNRASALLNAPSAQLFLKPFQIRLQAPDLLEEFLLAPLQGLRLSVRLSGKQLGQMPGTSFFPWLTWTG